MVILLLSAVIQKAVNTKMAASHQVIILNKHLVILAKFTTIWRADLDREDFYFDLF